MALSIVSKRHANMAKLIVGLRKSFANFQKEEGVRVLGGGGGRRKDEKFDIQGVKKRINSKVKRTCG